jgi:hypothetical protein
MLTEMEACRITQSSLLEFLFTDSPTVVFRVFALCLLKLLVIHLDQRTGFFLKLHLSHGACFRLTLLHRVSSWLLVLLGVSQREVSWGVRFQYFGRQRRGIGAIISNWFSSEKCSQSCVGISFNANDQPKRQIWNWMSSSRARRRTTRSMCSLKKKGPCGTLCRSKPTNR